MRARLSAAAVVAFVVPLFVALVAARPVNQKMTVTFRCPTTAACTASDRIQGDGLGAFVVADSADPQWGANTLPGRTMFLDFTQPDGVPGCRSTNTCHMSFSTITIPADALLNPTDAADVELPNGLNDIPVGFTGYARLKINFPDPTGSGLIYTVRFNPTMYPGSTQVRVTRVATKEWVVEATAAERARLVTSDWKAHPTLTDEGVYVMPFSFRVVRP